MDFLYYDLRVAVLIAVFYIFYRLMLSRDSFHQLNRVVLLGTAVASFVLPLCVITIHHTEVLTAMPSVETSIAVEGATTVVSSAPWWQTALPVVYWSGVIITILHIILSISKVCILISRCEKHRQADGTVIAVADGEVSPFSRRFSGSIPPCGCCAPICVPSTSTRLMRRFSQAAPTRASINTF